MDLRPYGLAITLRKGMDLDALLTPNNLQVGYFSKNRAFLTLPSGRYRVGAFRGKGSFSEVRLVYDAANRDTTVKMIDMRNPATTVASVMREVIIHILLEKESADAPNGPYVPRFHEVAYDPYHHLIIIRLDTTQDILYDRYKAATEAENDIIIPNTIAQLAGILDFFYRRLAFNHRDCKPNNVLYNYDSRTGALDIKLIDFGYSCLCWNGITIHAGDRFRGKCNLVTRDLTQYLYATYTDHGIPCSPRLRALFRSVLQFEADGKECRMWRGCKAFGNPMTMWAHTYRFLDRGIVNPAAEPRRLQKRMLEFMGTETSIVGMPHCAIDRVLEPKTRRCVRRNSKTGRKTLRLSKRYSTPSPETLRRHRNVKRG